MSKKPWNIWSIENRWIRALVAWLVGPLAVAFLFVVTFAFSVLAAVHSAAVEFWYEFNHRGWRDVIVPLASAMLARKRS